MTDGATEAGHGPGGGDPPGPTAAGGVATEHDPDRDGSPWLSPEEQRSWRAYVVGSTWLLDRLDKDLQARHALSLSEYEVLVRLSESPQQRCRMAVLSDSLRHSRSRMTHTVERLERVGLVLREPAATDRRGVDAVLLPAGRDLLERAAPDHARDVRTWFTDLATTEEMSAVGAFFGRLTDTLTQGHPDADIR